MPTSKPTLALTTPVSASFPAEALKSAASARTPHSASWRGLTSAGLPSAGLPSAGLYSPAIAAIKAEEAPIKTPITPPIAYMDFLKMATSPATNSPIASPPPVGKNPLNRTSTAGSTSSVKSTASSGSEDSAEADGDREEKEIDSAPTTASSDGTDCSCDCDHVHKSPKTQTTGTIPPSPFASYPMSAPATGPASFPSLKIPPSPAASNPGGETPVASPFSARSVRSPFDWDAALKARRYSESVNKKTSHHSCSKSRTSIKHIREVVTRTVTYTPRMEPAPKGKRRKVE